ncbi:MAG: phosphate ABC transporter permease subunit PstC [Bacteroidales bacterium]|nr:phosphate ABC transporter permease subunit PstC [Bacteroidales bacterium]
MDIKRKRRKGFRAWGEWLMEKLLTLSGGITGLIILLIVIFLFKEGIGLFQSSRLDDGYVLLMNTTNEVDQLSADDLKAIFDEDVVDWEHFGGRSMPIVPLRLYQILERYTPEELGGEYEYLSDRIGELIASTPGVIAYIPKLYAPLENPIVKAMTDNNFNLQDFFVGKEWMPTATPVPLLGTLPLFMGTLWVSLFAILIALPLGLGVAIYLAELASPRMRRLLKPVIELLAGIPSVVYGFFGLVVLVPGVQKLLDLPVGETALVGSLILAIMALPTLISVAEESMKNTPRALREASLALGATHWQTIYRVVIPYASSGISAGVVLGIGRALGETMAVLMVTGNAALIPHSLLQPVRTIPATIAAELGEASAGGSHYQALFLLGAVLFIMTLIVNIIAEGLARKQQNRGF